MADNCYLLYNGGINVDLIKIDTNINESFQEAIANKEQMLSSTILFNTFDNTVDASYFSPEETVSGPSIAIYKKTPFQKYYDFITLLSDGTYSFYDYNVANNEYYHYLASIEIQTSTDPEYLVYQNLNPDGSLVYANINWDKWSLINIIQQEDGSYLTSGDLWTFRSNIDSEELIQNTNVTSWDTLGQYPKLSIGQKNYSSSTFTALLGDMEMVPIYKSGILNQLGTEQEQYRYTETINLNSPYGTNMEKLRAWKEFISDGETKLLRDLKGNKWIVQVLANPTQSVNVKSILYPVTISFQWQEIANIDQAAIINFGG